MTKTVAIIGHGFVGQGMERLFSRKFKTIVYDTKYGDGQKHEAANADLAVICVPTPQAPDGSCDTSIVEDVASWVKSPLVCIKSTVAPGTTDKLNKQHGPRFHFSPEYMGEPRNFVPKWRYPDPRDAVSHDWVTVGGPFPGRVLDYFAGCMAVTARYHATTALVAELAKYMENSYFALKVVFCAEFAQLAEAHDVDYYAVREAWLLDPRMNPDHTLYFPDNPGFGGKCLPKDLAGIVHAGIRKGLALPLLGAVKAANKVLRGGRAD